MQTKTSKFAAVIIARDESRCAEIKTTIDTADAVRETARITETICCISGAQARMVNLRAVKLILLSTPLSDEYGLDLAAELSHKTAAPILILTKGETAAEVRKKLDFTGAYVLARPVGRQALQTAAFVAVQAADRLSRLKSESEEQSLVFKAKVRLMTRHSMSEEEAHRYLQKLAMDSRKRLSDTAKTVLEQPEQPDQDNQSLPMMNAGESTFTLDL
jgi:response regulator NasT